MPSGIARLENTDKPTLSAQCALRMAVYVSETWWTISSPFQTAAQSIVPRMACGPFVVVAMASRNGSSERLENPVQ
jgi:hypothetical protein